ncbi:MAG TPA: GDP-mannose 4,6-dehydratase [Bryobacteraceae bacterium]|nr:GDP-mannose 4,6-dehydratase [Bryobacteraceae bacterium]
MTISGKNVVVTGAAGFIGSHLVERLLALGANVTAFVRYNSRNDTGFLAPHTKSIRIVPGDIRDPEALRSALEGAQLVFHLAALTGIPYSYVHPVEVVEVNTNGTLNVLVAARDAGLERVVVTSTSEVYGSARYVPIDEKHPKQPQSPYSASKIASDAVALSFHAAFQLPVTVVRPFNTYGPRQSDRAIIPTIISQALTQAEITVGNTTPTRDFTYVTDTVEGFLQLATSDATIGQEINLGTGTEVSIGDLVERINTVIGRNLPVRKKDERVRPESSEVNRLLSNNSRASELTGWRPCVSLDEGIRRTAKWVEQRLEMYDPGTYRI